MKIVGAKQYTYIENCIRTENKGDEINKDKSFDPIQDLSINCEQIEKSVSLSEKGQYNEISTSPTKYSSLTDTEYFHEKETNNIKSISPATSVDLLLSEEKTTSIDEEQDKNKSITTATLSRCDEFDKSSEDENIAIENWKGQGHQHKKKNEII